METNDMRTGFKRYLQSMDNERILDFLFQIMIFSAFWGTALFPVSFPGIGEFFLFRFAFLAVIGYYIFYNIKKKINPFKGRTKIEYMLVLLVGIMLLYGTISLVRAIDFGFTFRRLFNLTFDLLFLLLIVLYVDNQKKVKVTIYNCCINILLLMLVGVYETLFGGVFNNIYDNFLRVRFFNRLLQPPVVSYGNTNNYTSSLLFCLPILIVFLLYQYNNSKTEMSKRIYSSVLVFCLSIAYYLANAARARLVKFSMLTVLVGLIIYVIVYQRKIYKIIIACMVCLLMVSFTESYAVLRVKTINYLNAMKYERELVQADKTGVSVQKPTSLNEPKNTEIALVDQLLAKNNETGEVIIDINTVGGLRLLMLKYACKVFTKSYGLGVGLGNTEQMVKEVANEQFGGIWAMHFFPARIVADMGIFVLIPALVLIIMLLKNVISLFKKKNKSILDKIVSVFVVVSIICFPFLSISPSDAQDLLPMWICIAGLVLALIRIPSIYCINNDLP